MSPNMPSMLYGRRIQIAPAHPKMQCSPKFTATMEPELVTETNAWMAAFFGYTCPVPDGTVYELNREMLVMSQATYNKLKAQIGASHVHQ